MLSGDKAHELFTSSDPFPLHTFLEGWRRDGMEAPLFVLAVISAYNRMLTNCQDGRYGGKIRKS